MTKADKNAKARKARWYAEQQIKRSELRAQLKPVQANTLKEYLSLSSAAERAIDFAISQINRGL